MVEKTRKVIPVSEFRLAVHEGDRVLIDCRAKTCGCGHKYNGEEGVIAGFQSEDWVWIRLDGGVSHYRYRPDELKVL